MAAGKTTIGRHLARLLAVPFIDTDESIVAEHGPIARLFADTGEAGFRAVELAAVRAALAGPPGVISLGGGAVTHAPTRALLAERALRVYLDISPEEILVRLRRSRTIRPVVGDAPTEERVRALLAERLPYYRESDLIVPGPQRTKAAFAREIAARLGAMSKGPRAT
jgi:shikimate kinase